MNISLATLMGISFFFSSQCIQAKYENNIIIHKCCTSKLNGNFSNCDCNMVDIFDSRQLSIHCIHFMCAVLCSMFNIQFEFHLNAIYITLAGFLKINNKIALTKWTLNIEHYYFKKKKMKIDLIVSPSMTSLFVHWLRLFFVM